jgi:catechol 2,3-dioxygenase-like lactoylglutathione lyase family enzyme
MSPAGHSGFDHVTIAVADLGEAVEFFGLLGFEKTKAAVVSGSEMSQYMGNPDTDRSATAPAGATPALSPPAPARQSD